MSPLELSLSQTPIYSESEPPPVLCYTRVMLDLLRQKEMNLTG